MKRMELSLLIGIVCAVILSMCALHIECEEVRGSVLRLHVLANSDDEEDQRLKLLVRDRLLAVSEDIYRNARSKEEAVAATQRNLALLQNEAQQVVAASGCDDSVQVALEDAYFNTRSYGDITLPAGHYQALRVIIGKGEGHNWWCVMFPPLCISAASEEEAQLEDVLNAEQLDLVEGSPYEMKFRCVELYEEMKEYFSQQTQ